MNAIAKIIQKKTANIFIAVVAEKNEYVFKYTILKNSKIIQQDKKSFPMDEDRKFSSDIEEFLTSIQNRYKFIYISYFLDAFSQNCLPGCNENSAIKKEKIVSKCIDGKWMAYVLKSDIEWVKGIFADFGIDFIFSPFIILNNFIKDKSRKNKHTIHLLYAENSLTIMIFNGDDLIFGIFFRIPYKEFEFEDDEELKKESSEDIIEGIDVGEIDTQENEFSEFIDITELGEDDEETILNDAKQSVISSNFEELELFGKDALILKHLSSAIEEYYKNDKYDSEFIENVIIYKDSNISDDIINMIENDLFLSVELRPVDIKEEMIGMSIREVGF